MRINSPFITGSSTITGDLCVHGTVFGTITGIASTASYALNAETLDGLDSTQLVLTSSFNSYTSSISSSIGDLSGSISTTTSGLAGRITTVEGNYVTTGSNTLIGDQNITGSICSTGDIVTTGQIVAQTINVQQVTSSIVYSCGSNTFGCSLTNNQVFTGSVFITGSNIIACVDTSCFGGSVAINGTLSTSGIIPYGTTYKTSNFLDFYPGNDNVLFFHAGTSWGDPLIAVNGTTAGSVLTNSLAQQLVIKGDGTNGIGFSNGSCINMIIKGSCVGIRTTSPRSTLHVQQATNDGTPNVGCARDGLIVSSNNGNYGLNIGVDPTGPSWLQSGRFDDGATGYNLLLQPTNRCSVLIGTGSGIGGCRQQLVIGGNGFGSLIALGNNGNGDKFVIESDSSENVLINNKSATPMIFYTSGSRRFDITSTGIACFACQICANSLTVATDCSGVVVDVANRHGFMKYVNYSSGLVGACSGTDSNIATWLGRFAGTIFAPTAVYQDLVVDGSGNVGVGTITPSAKLNVGHNAHGLGFSYLGASALPSIAGLFTSNGTAGGYGFGDLLIKSRSDYGVYNMIFYTACTNNTPLERMRITPGGNLGIGTTSPSYLLDMCVSLSGDRVLARFQNNPGVGSEGAFIAFSTGYSALSLIGARREGAENDASIIFAPMLNEASCERIRITSAGHLIPTSNGTQDLGSSTCRWCTVYTSDLSLNNGIGNYTIVEGQNDLFIYNNNSCKVYKFLLQEVCPEMAPAKRSI